MMISRSERRGPGEPLIELRGVSKCFTMRKQAHRSFEEAFVHLFRRGQDDSETFWPVHNLSLSVHEGESIGIIGPNGAGKSTLLKLITGILEPTSGDIITRGRISSLLELGAGFHGDLTGRENIYLNGSIMGISRSQMRRRIESIIDFAEIGEFIDVPVKHYSSGMYVRLGFAVAIHTDPDLLIVDEVLAVGDTIFQHKCMDSIQKFRANGGTLLLVSHDLQAIQQICQKAIWLQRGRLNTEGRPTDIVMAYLNAMAEQEEKATAKETVHEPGPGRRWGTGRVRITRVETCDANGQPCSIFVEGGDLEIHIHYRSEKRVEAPVFGLAIYHQNGTHICGPNTGFAGHFIRYVEGDGEIVYRIPCLPLLEGGYLISVSSHNQADTECFDYHDRVYSFRVHPGRSGEHYGIVTLNGEWYANPSHNAIVGASCLSTVAVERS